MISVSGGDGGDQLGRRGGLHGILPGRVGGGDGVGGGPRAVVTVARLVSAS
jgi:hypothetical protein